MNARPRTIISEAFDEALAKARLASAFAMLLREFYMAAVGSLRRHKNMDKAAEDFLVHLRRSQAHLKFVRAVDADMRSKAPQENGGEGGQSADVGSRQVLFATSPSPVGEERGQKRVAGDSQQISAASSPSKLGEGRGRITAAEISHLPCATPSPSPLRGDAAKDDEPTGHRPSAAPAAKPKSSPGHTRRTGAVIAIKNNEIKRTLLDTYIVEGKPLAKWRLRELPALFTGNYERAAVVRAIYERNHNRDQELMVGEVENAEAVEALVKQSHKSAVAAFRHGDDLRSVG